jgi:hypothetical protein
MTRKLTTYIAAVAIFGSLVTATTVFAQETTPSLQQPQTQGAMGGHGGMTNMMGQMSPDHMKQMAQMVDSCNRMMVSMGNAPTEADKERAPATHE